MFRYRFMRYLYVGAFAYAIEMAALYFLHTLLHLESVLSVAISFWVGFIVAFILQKIIAFQSHDRTKRVLARQLIAYSLLVGWNYLFTLVLVGVLSSYISVFFSRTITILATVIWNFWMYKKIFKTTPEGI